MMPFARFDDDEHDAQSLVTANRLVVCLDEDDDLVVPRSRWQRGDCVSGRVQPATRPLFPPVATIFPPAPASPVTCELAVLADDRTFQWRWSLCGPVTVGNYLVSVAYVDATGPVTLPLTAFEVVAGGDSGGAVIALYGSDHPESKAVLAQLSSGRLVQGSNPRL